MKKAKVFQLKAGRDNPENKINEWLSQNQEKKIISTAGIGDWFYVILYED